MSKEALIAGHEIKKAFLKEVINEGSWKVKPDNLSDDQWLMQRKIGFQYAFTDKTLDELGKQYPGRRKRTKEDIRQLNQRFLDNIYRNSSSELQAEYPRESIPDSKPRARKSKELVSRSNQGLSWQISKFIETTKINDPREIAAKFRISMRKVNQIRQVLRGWEIIIPSTVARYRDFVKKVESESNDQKLQEILDGSSTKSLLHYRQKYGDEVIMSLAQVVRKAGFYPPYNYMILFAQSVKKQGIPIRFFEERGERERKYRQRHLIVFTKHKKRIVEALRNDSSLRRFKRNPVQLICGGRNGKIPTLTELSQKDKFQPLGPLALETIGFRSSRAPRHNLGYLLKGCPVKVYKEGRSYLYPQDQTSEIKTFLAKRAGEIQDRPSQAA